MIDCSDWQYDGPGCIQSEGDRGEVKDSSNTNQIVQSDDDECWTEYNCSGGNQYSRECCFEPYFYTTDDDSREALGPAGIYLEGNLQTILTNLGSVPGGQWEETASGKWSTDFALHTGYDMMISDEDRDSYGDPAYVIDDFKTTISVGSQPAYLHTYKNIHDPSDWVGATADLDEYQDYDIGDYVKETAMFAMNFYVERLPIIGDTLSTLNDVHDYVSTMHNMLTHDPEEDQTIELEYDVDSAATFSPWVRFRLDEMDPEQQVTIDINETHGSWNVETDISISVEAPSDDPTSLGAATESELQRRNIERHRVGDHRERKEEYRPELDDDDIIHTKTTHKDSIQLVN
ncbi:hypothetical protein [Natronobacterium texcoconense]|uniref:Uncharacterized protein n=1 Tax=Natronobacterium texcoconense TaxID=1095778 RepID=A0A1H1GT16_NATTX|nr:hypothetical protein [Natronobacterium texcoconense]SDR16193.1 hypothetical protein SAMN04489842_2587 [Natronobacterium texcoconense]